MRPKILLTVVAVELLIAAVAFIIAKDKTQFGQIASFITLLVFVFGLAYFLTRRKKA
jgi:hypothetical protein